MALTTQIASPADIQRTLNKIWESLETKNTTRASLFNLIFYSQQNHRAAYIQQLAQKVIKKFPSRILFICADKSSQTDLLKTHVSLLCSNHGEYDVACDYIHFEATGNAIERIPFVLLPHILPDLPVYLIWGEDPSQTSPLFHQLSSFATRLIFDSETTENLAHFSKSTTQLYETNPIDIADLNWARLESWRDLLSMVFYSEENLKHIQRSCEIAISYNAKESQFFCHTPIQSIYLQAWIACQLNWQYQSCHKEKDTLLFCYQSQHSTIKVRLIPVSKEQLPPGLILDLAISTLDQHSYSFACDLQHFHHITFNSADRQKCELPSHYILQKAESGHSLVKEITHKGTSNHFLKVLNLLKNLKEPLA